MQRMYSKQSGDEGRRFPFVGQATEETEQQERVYCVENDIRHMLWAGSRTEKTSIEHVG